jgi:hypothetical protein
MENLVDEVAFDFTPSVGTELKFIKYKWYYAAVLI